MIYDVGDREPLPGMYIWCGPYTPGKAWHIAQAQTVWTQGSLSRTPSK